jgi:predicted CXXCH cytochrome family protein
MIAHMKTPPYAHREPASGALPAPRRRDQGRRGDDASPGTFGLAAAALLLLLSTSAAGADSIVNSKHNLSANSSAVLHAETNTEVCVFCHTSHHTSKDAPLWNHASSGATYTPYGSSTTKARIGQPTGVSKVCLSCHDGTVALGMVGSGRTQSTIAFHNKVTTLPPGPSNLGTDLSDDHPVSFIYDNSLVNADGQLQPPQTLTRKVKLDHTGQVQCTACHDPHDNKFGKFLVQDNTGSSLCLNCHQQPSWPSSVHALAKNTWTGVGVNPWPNTTYKTVADNACESCHANHSAGGKARLLNFATEERNCYTCHSGTVATRNIAAEFNKPSVHPITLTHGVHDPAENPLTAARHVTCVDCHEPHSAGLARAAQPALAGAPVVALSPAIQGAKGVSAAGVVVNQISSESELCYRCHADEPGRGQAFVPRQFPQTNERLQFAPGNASFHPIQIAGRNPNVPSLLLPWRNDSLMQCTDCHNNDQGPGAGGTGPAGPHGSTYPALLERQEQLTDFQAESAANYALCYKCHSRSSILADQSFKAVNSQGQDCGHRFHIVDQQAACTTCHDPHGVPVAKHLINFNTAYVTPSGKGPISYNSTGNGSGNCTLTCHGYSHVNTAYPLPSLASRAPWRKTASAPRANNKWP